MHGISGVFIFLVYLVIVVFLMASMWKIFVKAGKPGWACLIPIYNMIVMLEIAGKPLWWIILFIIPIVNLVVIIMVLVAFAKSFGKDVGFAIGMILLGVVFYPILAFGDAKYIGPGGKQA